MKIGWKVCAVIAVAALGAGVAAGFALGSRANAQGSAAPAVDSPRRPKAISEAPNAAEMSALRAKVRELENELALARTPPSNALMVAEAPVAPPRNPLEQIKRDDPTRYARITNSIERFRQMRLDRARARDEILSSVDVSGMSPEGRRTHARYMALSAKRDEMMESMHREDVMSMTEEDRRAAFAQMRKLDGELRATATAERANLLNEMAKNLGFAGEDAAAIVETVREVVEATDVGMGPGHRGHRPPAPPR